MKNNYVVLIKKVELSLSAGDMVLNIKTCKLYNIQKTVKKLKFLETNRVNGQVTKQHKMLYFYMQIIMYGRHVIKSIYNSVKKSSARAGVIHLPCMHMNWILSLTAHVVLPELLRVILECSFRINSYILSQSIILYKFTITVINNFIIIKQIKQVPWELT